MVLTREQRIENADEADRLLKSAKFDAVFNSILRDNIESLLQLDVGSKEALEAHSMIKGLELIKGKLRAIANDGVMLRSQEPPVGSGGT